MSAAHARNRVVGFFVIGALLLLVAGVWAISSGRLFGQWRTWVVFLPGAASGLKEGAPVTMRGVQVGQVEDLQLFFTGEGHRVGIMVVIRVRRGLIKNLAGVATAAGLSDAELLRRQVAEGLRAEVKSSSPVAGQKSIELDFHPDRPARFSGIQTRWPEVPTAPSGLEILEDKIEATLHDISDIPVKEVVAQLRDTLAGAQRLLDSGDLHGTLANLRVAVASADRTLKSVDGTLGGVNGLVGDARATMTSANETVRSLRTAVDGINRTLETVDRNVERTADTQLEAARTLDEMRETMTSLRFLIDTLQQHPESLLQGKPKPEEKK